MNSQCCILLAPTGSNCYDVIIGIRWEDRLETVVSANAFVTPWDFVITMSLSQMIFIALGTTREYTKVMLTYPLSPGSCLCYEELKSCEFKPKLSFQAINSTSGH